MASKRRIKRSDRKRKCEGKVRYDTEADAQRACNITARRFHQSWLTVYRCKYCGGGWHFGHTPWHVRQAILSRK